MFLRIDKLPVEMPAPTKPDPNAAAAVQELLGGRFGEMSTFKNYLYQALNMRGRDKLGQYYELIANIAAEELGHIQLVAASINSLLNGAAATATPRTGDGPLKTPSRTCATPTTTSSPAMPPWSPTPWASRGAASTCSAAATWSSTCCTTSSSRTAPAPTSCASTR